MKNLTLRLSAAMWARVLLLWLTLGVGALVVGGIAISMGRFIQDNVRTELASQQISFTAADKLADAEKAIPGIVDNAGQPLTSGNQAQIYSNLIALHLQEAATGAGYPGATYATLGGIQGDLRTAVAAATKANDKAALDDANAKLTAATGLRNTMLTGNTLIGTLLSAYGWDNVGTGVIAAGVFIVVLAVLFFVLFFFEWRRGHLPPAQA